MAATRTPGITIVAGGLRFIDKRRRGVRIAMRVGNIRQEQAEQRLQTEMSRVDCELFRKAHGRPHFIDCAVRYLVQCKVRRSVETTRFHVRLLVSRIGHFEACQVHDATLEPFILERLSAKASATTIDRSLEVVRTILDRAARSYADKDGRPWLDALPPLITMLPGSPREPYPMTWDEQDRLFPMFPAQLGRMVLFAVNTGLRDNDVCALEWSWEVAVSEIGRSVFVTPAEARSRASARRSSS
jgi:integrase